MRRLSVVCLTLTLAVPLADLCLRAAERQAAGKGMTTAVRFLNPPTLPKPAGYTHVVEVRQGRTIYLSGQVALDADGNLVGKGDFRAQAEQVFRNIAAGLEAAGGSWGNIVKLSYFITDARQVPALREVRDKYVNAAQPPASSLVRVAGLVRDDFLLEIEAVAVVNP